VEAISKLKIDKITVWDSGSHNGSTTTSEFVSGLVKALPPLQEVAAMAGVELPEFLGKVTKSDGGAQPAKPAVPGLTIEASEN
jgi:flotillin